MTLKLENGDCLELMKSLPDKSIDLFICDLPYGETNCKWDCKIDLEEFWIQFKRLRKSKRVACIHFCSSKFGYTLIKSNEKMFKMDMVWVKRNKTGGLQSRHRPMRNHEMVYFFYEQSPKYNRDKYHKRIDKTPTKVSVIEDKEKEDMNEFGWSVGKLPKENRGKEGFNPVLPVSVIEEKDTVYSKKGWDEKSNGKGFGGHTNWKNTTVGSLYDPPNPVSVLEEEPNDGQKKAKDWGFKKCSKSFDDNENINGGRRIGANYDPPNPVSVIEEDEPFTTFKSKRVFIGKRHHQTEKPLDILEFFLKYWTDENDTVLDPTMGSGSTGVACKKLNRNFIGFELDEKIFKVAENRIKSQLNK